MSKAAAATLPSPPRKDHWAGDDLSVQYSAGTCFPAALEPEIRLMATILEDAVLCFQRYARARSNPGLSEFRDAERWLFGGDESDWIYSFENICVHLGLDPLYIRSGLRRWQSANQRKADYDDIRSRRGPRSPAHAPEVKSSISFLP